MAATCRRRDPLDPAVIGARVRRCASAVRLSLRDLAARSGVSAPMLSQVERGETSPTLAVAARIAAGLDLRLSQLLRLDEDGAVTVVRADERSAAATPGAATASRCSPRPSPGSAPSSPATRSPRAARPARPTIRRCTSPAAVRPRSSSSGAVVLVCDGQRHELGEGDCVTFDADLPHHFENPGRRAGGLPRRRQRRAAQELTRR